MAQPGRARSGSQDAGRPCVRRRSAAQRARGFAEEIRPERADPQPRDVRRLARRIGDRGTHRRARALRSLQRAEGLQRGADGHSPAHRVVRKFRGGVGRRAGQGESRLSAQGQDRAQGQPGPGLRASRTGACHLLAQGRFGQGRERRDRSGRRRGRRRCRLCRRVRHHRRVRTRPQGARDGYVLVGDRRHVGHLGSIARPRHRRSGPELLGPHDPPGRRCEAAEDARTRSRSRSCSPS